MKKLFVILLVCSCFSGALADVYLMKDGKDVSSVIIRKNASVVEKYAAKELSTYLGKIAEGNAPQVTTSAVAGKYPVYLEVKNDPAMKEESFRITVNKKGMYITGKEDVGVLYGVYSILKKYGGIRWLIPGKDGEYFKVKKSISVPEGSYQESPSFFWRDFQIVCTGFSAVPETRKWGLRNNMRFHISPSVIKKNKLEQYAPIHNAGGHSFSPLLHLNYTGKYKKSGLKYQSGFFVLWSFTFFCKE